VACGLVLALVVWAAAPTGGNDAGTDALVGTSGEATTGSGSTAGSAATGAASGSTTGQPVAVTGGAGSAVTGATSGTGPGTTVGTAGSSAATGAATSGTTTLSPTCLQAPSGQGVSDKEIQVGVVIVTIGALNSTIGIPSEADHKKAYQALFDDYNKRGGVQCRKLVPRFYTGNPLDASTERAACLQMQQDKIFAVINNLFNNDTTTCVAQAKIPNFWYTSPHTTQIRKYTPYILSFQADYDRLVTTYVRGAKKVGWFNGLNKVGILDQTCYPDLSSRIRSELTAVGIPKAKWSVFNYGCFTTGTGQEPDKDTQAAVQFARDGVTHVMSVAYAKTSQFAKQAEQQQYRPKYAIMSDAQIQAADRSSAGQAASLDGALDVTSDQIGAENTPGAKFTAATAPCRAIMKAAGVKDPVDPLGGTASALYGVACASTKLLVTALQRIPSLQRSALAAGLARAGSLDLSFPAGPSIFNSAANPTGGQFWRTAAFESDCNCWMVTSAAWRRGFA
jgi:hypothetical protein